MSHRKLPAKEAKEATRFLFALVDNVLGALSFSGLPISKFHADMDVLAAPRFEPKGISVSPIFSLFN